jgi:hypothetical protein
MSKQNRTVIGALDYSIASLQNLKGTLMDISHPQKELNWAVGGIIITLTSHLLRVCQDTFIEATQTDEANAKTDMLTIKTKFNDFMERMISNG